MNNETVLKALYFQRKIMISQFYKLNPEKSGISSSYAYAISNDCYPIFHAGDDNDDIYDNFYRISKKKISQFVNYVDEMWQNNKKMTFYELEKKFGGKSERFNIIAMLRYCYLDNRFTDNNFWSNLESDSPIEGKNINKDLNFWEL